jgi:hypothetical protein
VVEAVLIRYFQLSPQQVAVVVVVVHQQKTGLTVVLVAALQQVQVERPAQ